MVTHPETDEDKGVVCGGYSDTAGSGVANVSSDGLRAHSITHKSVSY